MSCAKPIYFLCAFIFISLLVATIFVSRRKEGHHQHVLVGNETNHHEPRVFPINAIPDQSYVDNEAMSSSELEHSANSHPKPADSESAHREHTTASSIRPFVFSELCMKNSKEVSELLEHRLADCEKQLVDNGNLSKCFENTAQKPMMKLLCDKNNDLQCKDAQAIVGKFEACVNNVTFTDLINLT